MWIYSILIAYMFYIFRLCALTLVCLNVSDYCRLNYDEGQGSSFNYALYYDAKTDQCNPFIYKGEGGNANHFKNERECIRNCSANIDRIYPLEGKMNLWINTKLDSSWATYQCQNVWYNFKGTAKSRLNQTKQFFPAVLRTLEPELANEVVLWPKRPWQATPHHHQSREAFVSHWSIQFECYAWRAVF